ncbi:hypothetical protein CIK05_11495 [Bdellovibrio sp. qaytius]|nr:hypothetical protein CIK05_11495 [Bdellovibrio sp. qaytius]
MKLLSLLITAFLLSGCGSQTLQSESPEAIIERASQQKIFYAPYDEVWKAAHSIIKYTIAAENQDFGVIETDYIKAVDGWLPPFRTKPQYPSSRYKLVISFARGKKGEVQETVRVTIEKKIEVFKDFISEVKTVNSDGFEEKTIFYRIERELVIAKAIKKASENPN